MVFNKETPWPGPLQFDPIGVIHTPYHERLSAPRQPAEAAEVAGEIELRPGRNLEHALEDIATWSHLWVIFVFDRNEGWRPKVMPPRSGRQKRGVLATRAPYRPNPIGLSVVRLDAVEGLTLRVRGVDMLDGSPVLDIKPYVPYTDSISEATGGWLGAAADPGPRYEIRWGDEARAQIAFLAPHLPALEASITEVLSVSPHPQPYRRIRVEPDGARTLSLRDWRVRFTVDGQVVHILALRSGYRASQLAAAELPADLSLHRDFVRHFAPDALPSGG